MNIYHNTPSGRRSKPTYHGDFLRATSASKGHNPQGLPGQEESSTKSVIFITSSGFQIELSRAEIQLASRALAQFDRPSRSYRWAAGRGYIAPEQEYG